MFTHRQYELIMRACASGAKQPDTPLPVLKDLIEIAGVEMQKAQDQERRAALLAEAETILRERLNTPAA